VIVVIESTLALARTICRMLRSPKYAGAIKTAHPTTAPFTAFIISPSSDFAPVGFKSYDPIKVLVVTHAAMSHAVSQMKALKETGSRVTGANQPGKVGAATEAAVFWTSENNHNTTASPFRSSTSSISRLGGKACRRVV
jgi:hypothetical protein